jgi:hypothetical protein
MIVVSGCTSSNFSSDLSTSKASGVTTPTPATTQVRYPTSAPIPTVTKWGGCTCTVGSQNLHCYYSDGHVVSTYDLKGTGKDFNRYSGYDGCTYMGGSSCMCAESSTQKCTDGTCACTRGSCTSTGSTRICTRDTCACTPGTCTYQGGGTCTCTPESCTCTDWDTCSCTQKLAGTCDPGDCLTGHCYCNENPCTCT